MIRLLIWLLVLAVLTIGAVTLWTIEGRAIIDAGQWQVRMDSSLLLILVLVGFVGTVFLTWSMAWFSRGAKSLFRNRRDARRIHMLRTLVKGYALLAADVPNGAKKYHQKLKLDDPDALFAATLHASTAPGEDRRTALENALDDPALVPLAVRHLMNLESVQSDTETFDALLATAANVAPDADWSRQARYDQSIRKHDWQSAAQLIDGQGRMASEKRAALLLEGARESLAAADYKAALTQAEHARKHAPFWSPAVAITLKAMHGLGRHRRAWALLKSAWNEHPHPDLVAAFTLITAKETPDSTLKKARSLVGPDPDGYAARLMWVQALLRSDRTQETSLALNSLCRDYPTRLVLHMRAKFSEATAPEQAEGWLKQAVEANDLGGWGCNACGSITEDWTFVCNTCQSTDTIVWRAPLKVNDPENKNEDFVKDPE